MVSTVLGTLRCVQHANACQLRPYHTSSRKGASAAPKTSSACDTEVSNSSKFHIQQQRMEIKVSTRGGTADPYAPETQGKDESRTYVEDFVGEEKYVFWGTEE